VRLRSCLPPANSCAKEASSDVSRACWCIAGDVGPVEPLGIAKDVEVDLEDATEDGALGAGGREGLALADVTDGFVMGRLADDIVPFGRPSNSVRVGSSSSDKTE
jgi:hypothetical protein